MKQLQLLSMCHEFQNFPRAYTLTYGSGLPPSLPYCAIPLTFSFFRALPPSLWFRKRSKITLQENFSCPVGQTAHKRHPDATTYQECSFEMFYPCAQMHIGKVEEAQTHGKPEHWGAQAQRSVLQNSEVQKTE